MTTLGVFFFVGYVIKVHGEAAPSIFELADPLEEASHPSGGEVNSWRHQELRYPAKVVPPDALVSRCYRELDERPLR